MTDQTRRYRFEQFFAYRRTAGFAPAPDGESVLFINDMSGQLNLWRTPSAGGWPEQLTLFQQESVRYVTVARDGRRIAFVADTDGDERYQVYLMDAQGGWPEKLTDQPAIQYELGAFSADGRFLTYSGNPTPDSPDVGVYLHDLETDAVRLICGGPGVFYSGAFSPDGRQLLVFQFHGNTDQDIWLVDVATGERRNLTAHGPEQAIFFPHDWREDGTGFYYLSNEGREFQAVGFYDLRTNQRHWLLTPDWDVEAFSVAAGGNLAAYAVNEAGNSTLYLYNLKAGCNLPTPTLPRGNIAAMAFGETDDHPRLFLQMGTYCSASTVHVLNLSSGELQVPVPVMLGHLPESLFVAPELIEIPSFDGLRVPAWLYRPHTADPAHPVPAVLTIHGGPEAQERPTYSGYYQYLLSRGIAVLAPNIRGSSGFGIAYQKQVHRDWGGGDLKDIEACAQYLQSLDWVDSNRLAVWGGSYGGFATLSAASRLPQYWAAACDLCGPVNLVTFVDTVPPHWKPMLKGWIGDAEEDRALLVERSPITYVDQIQAPLMILQGANDPRVVKAESDQMVERLRSLGRSVEYLVFEDEGHGFAKRSNQLRAYRAMADYLLKQLGIE